MSHDTDYYLAPSLTVATPEIVYDVKVEDGKLHYEGKRYYYMY